MGKYVLQLSYILKKIKLSASRSLTFNTTQSRQHGYKNSYFFPIKIRPLWEAKEHEKRERQKTTNPGSSLLPSCNHNPTLFCSMWGELGNMFFHLQLESLVPEVAKLWLTSCTQLLDFWSQPFSNRFIWAGVPCRVVSLYLNKLTKSGNRLPKQILFWQPQDQRTGSSSRGILCTMLRTKTTTSKVIKRSRSKDLSSTEVLSINWPLP